MGDALKAIYDEAEATQTTPDKDAIAATSDLCTPFFKDENGNPLVKNLIVPTILVAILATFVAIMFFEVFGMGTTVLLQCFIADEEMFKNDAEGCFATNSLKKYLNKNGKSRKKKK